MDILETGLWTQRDFSILIIHHHAGHGGCSGIPAKSGRVIQVLEIDTDIYLKKQSPTFRVPDKSGYGFPEQTTQKHCHPIRRLDAGDLVLIIQAHFVTWWHIEK
jgi:hypothetical protein